MFEALDRVPWAKLTHAYGKAGDLPAHLRSLVSSDGKKRAKALFQIGASICHQGSMYSATAPATHVLVELVSARKTPDRAAILKLLGDIATLDDDGPFLLDGMPASPKVPKAWKEGLAAVRAGADTYVALLADKDAEVRARAAYLLAWIPSKASGPALAKALAKEKDAAVRASLVLALSYVDPKGATPTFVKLISDEDTGVRVAAAIANANATKGKPTPEAVPVLARAAKTKLVVKKLGFDGGNLGAFATQVLAALPPSDATNDALLAAIATGSHASFAANVMVRRLFTTKSPPKKKEKRSTNHRRDVRAAEALAAIAVKPADLAPRERAFFAAVSKNEDVFDNDLVEALGERGFPIEPGVMTAWLGGASTGGGSILDRELRIGGKSRTLNDAVLAAVKAKDDVREKLVAEIVDAVPAKDLVELAMTIIFDLDVDYSSWLAVDLMWIGGPRCKAEIAAEAKKLEKSGVPKRRDGESVYLFPMCLVAVAVGAARVALSEKKTAAPWVDKFLQETYGFIPHVRDALAALPMERREKWVLSSKRDDQGQPSDGFKGAWPYFQAVPTTKVTNRALAHVKKWRPKDPWDGPRKKYADPLLAAFAKALRDAGNEEDAERCEAALAALP